jgi:hypothetical protein
MQKQIDAISLLSSAAMTSKKAETYPPETYVIDLAELRQIVSEMQERREMDAYSPARKSQP